MRRHNSVLVVLILIVLALSACSRQRKVQSPPPPVPTRTAEAEPTFKARVSPADRVLVAARAHAEAGESLLRDGDVERAREAFESALRLLRDFNRRDRSFNFEIEREIDFLIVRIETLETTQHAEKAAIDELTELDPSTLEPDPKLRDRARADIAEHAYDLPVTLNDDVVTLMDYFTEGRGRRTMAAGLERIGLYRPMISKIFAEEGVPQDLVYLAQAESLFKPQAVSRALAKGMWQFISSRGAEYGLRQNWWIDERSDPEKSTRAAARHLRDLYAQFGDWYLAMAAYNSGPARVERAIARAGSRDFWTLSEKRLLPQETRNYVPTIVAMMVIGKSPAEYGFDVKPAPALEVERVPLRAATDLRVIAEQLDLPLDLVQDLNPHVLRWATPPDDPDFELILPAGYGPRFHEKVATLPENKRILYRHHVVQRGETLSHLSVRYGVSVRAIADSNRIDSQHIIRIGQSLIIPLSGVATPATALAAAVPGPDVPETYHIRRGDTLSGIAARFGIAMGDIRSMNGMRSNRLIAGETLRLRPAGGEARAADPGSAADSRKVVYRVRPGDTLSKIAASYRTSVDDIRAWNRDADLSIIRPGDRITIYTQQ